MTTRIMSFWDILLPQIIVESWPASASASDVPGSRLENVAAFELGGFLIGRPLSSTWSCLRLGVVPPGRSDDISPRLSRARTRPDAEAPTNKLLEELAGCDDLAAFLARVGLELETYRMGDDSDQHV